MCSIDWETSHQAGEEIGTSRRIPRTAVRSPWGNADAAANRSGTSDVYDPTGPPFTQPRRSDAVTEWSQRIGGHETYRGEASVARTLGVDEGRLLAEKGPHPGIG